MLKQKSRSKERLVFILYRKIKRDPQNACVE